MATETTNLSWESVLNDLSAIGPTFPCNADDIDILSTPTEFYEALVQHSRDAKDRIFISTLYVGQGEREKHLVESMESALQRNADLRVSILMDYCRSLRNVRDEQSSLHTLLPLFNAQYSAQMDVRLFRTPNLQGVWSYFPERSREVVGVHHMKAFVFDDTIIISGANLNETYLENRQDRYFVFKNNKALSDHVYGMMSTLSDHCPNVRYAPQQQEHLHPFAVDMEVNRKCGSASTQHDVKLNVEHEPDTWFDFICQQLAPFTTPSSSAQNQDTHVVLSVQMMNKINTDFAMTSYLLRMKQQPTTMKIATAYFNLAQQYEQALLSSYESIYQWQRGSLQVLTASEECNSFYKAAGLAGYVTPLYEHFAAQFEQQIEHIRSKMYPQTQTTMQADTRQSLFTFRRYCRPNWTYHGKGIWIDVEENQNEQPFSLSMVGSSNYGQRSVNRDTEMNFTVVTKNASLRSRLKQEWNNLAKYSNHDASDENKPKESSTSSFLIQCMSGLLRNLM